MPPGFKPRIGNFEFAIMLTIAFMLWGLMLLLSLPLVTELGSVFVGISGSALFAGWFWVRGAFKDRAAVQNGTTTLISFAASCLPFIDDLPIMIIETVAVFVVTRLEDIRLAKEKIAKRAAAEENQKRAQVRQQAAYIAAQNANAMREQALAESQAIATAER